MELREMRVFVAILEEGSLSAAARRLHVSQPALSQTVGSLERQFGLQLLERSRSGVCATEAGRTLLAEARAVIERHDRALMTMAEKARGDVGVLRLGVPLELPPDLLTRPLEALVADHPRTRIEARHLTTAAQRAALHYGELDVGLLRERPMSSLIDSVLVVEEPLGVLVAKRVAAELAEPGGVRLEALKGLDWLCFPRSDAPDWYDELALLLRGHGLRSSPAAPDADVLIAPVKFAMLAGGTAFAFTASQGSQALPDTLAWCPLVGDPLVRRTWAAWQATSRRRDIGRFIAAFDPPATDSVPADFRAHRRTRSRLLVAASG